MNDRLRKYLAYAVGELLLIVVGILVALQIDNWNDDRQEQATLESYLQAIARNMREDLDELSTLRARRVESLDAGATFTEFFPGKTRFDVDEVFFAQNLLDLSRRQMFFNANTSGFEALKNSGVLDRLQGLDLERLLSAYYDEVRQIESREGSLNELTRILHTDLARTRRPDVEIWAFFNPSALAPERFEELQPVYRAYFNSPEVLALGSSQLEQGQLILHYDSLAQLGEAFIRNVEKKGLHADGTIPRTRLDDLDDHFGLPEIVSRGQPQREVYFLGRGSDLRTTDFQGDDGMFRFDSLSRRGDALHIDYGGGAEWAVVYWVPMIETVEMGRGRSHLDFSRFSTLHLELRGDEGGESVRVHLKDADDADDEAPVTVDLILTDDWQVYEIDLSEFAPTDLSRLHVVLGLLFHPGEEPRSFSVRNARYQ